VEIFGQIQTLQTQISVEQVTVAAFFLEPTSLDPT
jgi:hypothetical protein